MILTTLDLAPSLSASERPPADLCGNCTLCLDACPTQAFAAPYVLESRRCISYLTIELRGAIPEALRPQIGNAIFGCDICQDVCPWNRKAPVTTAQAFAPRESAQFSTFAPELEAIAKLSQAEFSSLFRGSAVKRAKWRGLLRNACVALGNAKFDAASPARARAIRVLQQLAASGDVSIAEHARWALTRLDASN